MDKIEGLVGILYDETAREDEREDAAMYLGNYNDEKALNALVAIASDPTKADYLLDSCGISIAHILILRNEFRRDIIDKLTPFARRMALGYIKEQRSDWCQ